MPPRHRRRRPLPARAIVAAGGVIVAVGVGASVVEVAQVSASVDVPIHTTAPIVVAEIPWTLNLPAGEIVAGLTVSAPLAPLPLAAPPVDQPVPGLDAAIPIDFDHVAAYQRAWEQNKNTAALNADASQRDEAWQKARGLQCDDTTPQSLRPLCK